MPRTANVVTPGSMNKGSADLSKDNHVRPEEFIERTIEKLERLGKQYSLSQPEKERRMNKLISQVCKKVDALEDKGSDGKARIACWKGRAHGSLPFYSEEAENFLKDAVKLVPGMVEAWNSLGTE